MPSRIAIIGAGPGGLLCARVLQRHGIAVTVYDSDASVTARDPGGTLDLHADSGQIALEDAGLMADFLRLARLEDQAKRRLDHHGNVLHTFVPDAGDAAAPEIDRGRLRALLAAHVEPGTVRWGHRLTTAVPLGGGRHRLEFADGGHAEADLVIGADGAWSRVRPLLSDAVPAYTGISFLDVRYDDADHRHPRIAAIVGEGHMFARDDDGRAIIAQRNSDGLVRAYLAMRTGLDWHTEADVDLRDSGAVRRFLLREFGGWSERLLPFLTEADDSGFVHRPIWALPAPLTWAHVPGVTLLGDAAHLMAPFGGFGVNLALLDAAELARAIAEEPTLDQAVIRYEATMLPRSGPLAAGANDALARFFAPGDFATARVPDHEAEHRHYREAAARYRLDGVWTVSFRTPRGRQESELVLAAGTEAVTGTFDGAAIEDGRLDGTGLSFSAVLTSPFRVRVAFTASIDGDTMSGQAKAPMMTIPITGTRRAA